MSYYIYIHIFLLAIKFNIPNKIIITPIIIYIKLILINLNKIVIKKLNITPNKFKTIKRLYMMKELKKEDVEI